MTNVHRVQIGLGLDPSCKACNTIEEDIVHILRDCPLAREVWYLLLPYNSITNFFTLPILTWLAVNLEPCSVLMKDWPLLYAVTSWWLRKWRNHSCFEDNNFQPHRPWHFILTKFKEVCKALNTLDPLGPNVNRKTTKEIFIKWEVPPHGWMKMNLDGASKGNPGHAGGGGTIGDNLGKWIRSFSANFGRCTSVKAELLALLKGLQIARAEGIGHLLIQMDSQIVVNKIKEPVGKYQVYGKTIKKCQMLMTDPDWTVKISHCFRESNKVADFLANRGVVQSTPLF